LRAWSEESFETYLRFDISPELRTFCPRLQAVAACQRRSLDDCLSLIQQCCDETSGALTRLFEENLMLQFMRNFHFRPSTSEDVSRMVSIHTNGLTQMQYDSFLHIEMLIIQERRAAKEQEEARAEAALQVHRQADPFQILSPRAVCRFGCAAAVFVHWASWYADVGDFTLPRRLVLYLLSFFYICGVHCYDNYSLHGNNGKNGNAQDRYRWSV
jgi:hypothetical protein